jgi:aromatase
MFTSNTVEIRGEAARILNQIYQLAADIQDWPTLLPHYEYIRVLEKSDTHKVADFGAVREFGIGDLFIHFPCRWRARQELFPDDMRITFKHLKGITRGMWVEWRLEDCGDHVRVTIDHELTYPIPVLGPLFAQFIVGNIFVHNVASKTLNCIKAKVESESL